MSYGHNWSIYPPFVKVWDPLSTFCAIISLILDNLVGLERILDHRKSGESAMSAEFLYGSTRIPEIFTLLWS